MKRPKVEEFKRLCGIDTPYWGMADADVIELCDYILYLERKVHSQSFLLMDDAVSEDSD